MAASSQDIAFIFGLFGNIFSVLVYLAPLPTFRRIYRKKSTEGFLSIPYSVSLFTAMLTLYYAFLKRENAMLLITINSIGCFIESAYLLTYIVYAARDIKIQVTRLFLGFNVTLLSLIIVLTGQLTQGSQRVEVVGWICAVFSIAVFASPLSVMVLVRLQTKLKHEGARANIVGSITNMVKHPDARTNIMSIITSMRMVIRTKSVEFMPFWLSFFLTLCAVMWFFYGVLIKDFFIATPNVLGFAFGVFQMVLYMCYKNHTTQDSVKTVECEFSKFKEMNDVAIVIHVEPDETSASSYESESGSGDDSIDGAN